MTQQTFEEMYRAVLPKLSQEERNILAYTMGVIGSEKKKLPRSQWAREKLWKQVQEKLAATKPKEARYGSNG